MCVCVCVYVFCLFIFDRERERKQGRGRREGGRESQAGSTLSAQSLTEGLKPMNHEVMTWAKIKSQTLNQLSHQEPLVFWYLTLVPIYVISFYIVFIYLLYFFFTGKASQLYSHNLPGLFDYARQMQKLPVAIPAHKLPDRILPR